jgi:hypothetical protein
MRIVDSRTIAHFHGLDDLDDALLVRPAQVDPALEVTRLDPSTGHCHRGSFGPLPKE